MSYLFHFKEKIYKKNLSKAKAISFLFPRQLSYVLEHLGFPAEPHCERLCVCEATFTVEKWQFVPGVAHLPTFPPIGEAQQVDPPGVQQHPSAPA